MAHSRDDVWCTRALMMIWWRKINISYHEFEADSICYCSARVYFPKISPCKYCDTHHFGTKTAYSKHCCQTFQAILRLPSTPWQKSYREHGYKRNWFKNIDNQDLSNLSYQQLLLAPCLNSTCSAWYSNMARGKTTLSWQTCRLTNQCRQNWCNCMGWQKLFSSGTHKCRKQ